MNNFSVIMPIYNQAAFIRRSISSLLKQTYSQWELIIIDGSTDAKYYERVIHYKAFANVRLLLVRECRCLV